MSNQHKIKPNTSFDIERLYDDYSHALYGVIARIIKDEFLAAEVLQDTFVKIWKYQDRYQNNKSSLFTWMMHIAKNTAINAYHSKANKYSKNTAGISDLHENSGLRVASINTDTLDLKNSLSKIDDKYREIIELIYLRGYTHKDAARYLMLPIGTVKSRIKIGIRELRSIYTAKPAVTGTIISLLLSINFFTI